ncbi:hypothetical protein OPW39_15675 [Vibrio europaeus]|uniref:hypothetical protein n=1 Tax=Vibrio europaeus TaxID=300876 RepID=UPI00233F475A|nr:hypothetical protein [Vibrio europaeus]MDC5870247.1 hypothetical protein [Vibrio europaeus]
MNQLSKTIFTKLTQACEVANKSRRSNQVLLDEIHSRLDIVLQDFLVEKKSDIDALEASIETSHESALAIIEPQIKKLETYIDARTDRWRESEAGTNVQDWLDELSQFRDEIEEGCHIRFEPNVGIGLLDSDPLELPRQSSKK